MSSHLYFTFQNIYESDTSSAAAPDAASALPAQDMNTSQSQVQRMETSSADLDPSLTEEMDVIVPESPPTSPAYVSVVPGTPPTPDERTQRTQVTVSAIEEIGRHVSGGAEYTQLRPNSKGLFSIK